MRNYSDEHGDHIHSIAFSGDHAEPVTDTDDFYAELDRRLSNEPEPEEQTVTFGEVAYALTKVLDFICAGMHPGVIAGRALALQQWLHPERSNYDGVAQIAVTCGVSKQALSKAVLEWHDSLGMRLPVGKRAGARQVFRETAFAELARGSHVSQTRARKSNS